ncbi:MAG: radical SAM protein [Actinobacteria bacterium]|nr:MAG: radical SAM protein [Actinomycetota bacterium]
MSDRFRIDSHKLIYHPDRVADWLAGRDVYPVYVEISPAGYCNHRCAFCALDFVGYRAGFLDADLLKERLTEMGRLGVRSVLYAGEGEPLLHKRIAEIVNHTKASGIDVALTTNAVLLDREMCDEMLPSVTWTKVSIAGGTPDTYREVQGASEGDFERVIENMSYAADARRAGRHSCTLGMQLLLLPENADEVVTLARIAKDIGMDYLVVKPYSQHPSSITQKYADIRYSDYLPQLEEARTLSGDGFEVIARVDTMERWDSQEHCYERCLALPFWAYVSTAGGVWACSAHLGEERFEVGNINDATFETIWTGERRRQLMRWVAEELDTSECRVNCRMDHINEYLWELTHPSEHVNFI